VYDNVFYPILRRRRLTRDMGLIRELLLKLESLPMQRGDVLTITPDDPEVSVEGYSGDQIDYHLSLIREVGLIECPGSQPMDGVTFSRLSWRGHEFLDDVRDPDVWRKTKERAKTVTTVGLGFLWEIAKAEIKTKLGLP
jgi:hypothetical protein